MLEKELTAIGRYLRKEISAGTLAAATGLRAADLARELELHRRRLPAKAVEIINRIATDEGEENEEGAA